MSVLCCHTPDFLLALTYRQQPQLQGKPLALLGEDERIWAVSQAASGNGVAAQMSVRQAQTRCPAVLLHALDLQAAQTAQAAFVDTLVNTGLPVEVQAYGTAYVDLQALAPHVQQAQALSAELGRQLRNAVGYTLQPALGWDCGKFTARVAAVSARPGRMRLVGRAEEPRFLAPQPVTLLPLPHQALQQLRWLGIQTLGQLAGLPEAAVVQRFGAAGKLARRLAQGRDERPVQATSKENPEPIRLDFNPPTVLSAPVVGAAMAALHTHLSSLAHQLLGIRRLRLTLRFSNGSTQTADCTFVEPVADGARLRQALTHQLQAIIWHGELTALEIAILALGEQAPQQLALFADDTPNNAVPLQTMVEKLMSRYADVFFRGQMQEASHPVAERRSQILTLL